MPNVYKCISYTITAQLYFLPFALVSHPLLWLYEAGRLRHFRGGFHLSNPLHLEPLHILYISLKIYIVFLRPLGFSKGSDLDRPGYAMYRSQVDIQVYDLVNGIVLLLGLDPVSSQADSWTAWDQADTDLGA